MTISLTPGAGASAEKAPKTRKVAKKTNIENATPAAAPAATPAKTATATADTKVKTQAAVNAAAPINADVDKSLVGSMSETIEFIAPLVDPSVPDKTPIKIDGVERDITTGTIVGYRFKSSVPITIPDCGLDSGFRSKKNGRMNFVNINGERQVKAGEEFDLTPFEMGVLLSDEKYNSYALGGKNHVRVQYRMEGAEKKDGTVEMVSESTDVPGILLKGIDGCVIKTMEMIDVLTFVKEPATGKGNPKIKRTIKPGFEKWSVLCEVGTRTAKAPAAKVDPKKTYNKSAQTFMNIVNAKKRKQA